MPDEPLPLHWAEEMMARAGVTVADVARSWAVSQSSVMRWLDGRQTSDISLVRAVKFARLVGRPINEIAARLVPDE